MKNWFYNLFNRTVLGGKRDSRWPQVRRYFLYKNPICSACGSRKDLEVHHITPVHIDASKELDEENLMALCREHHLFIGHLNSWYSYNSEVKEDANKWITKILNRP